MLMLKTMIKQTCIFAYGQTGSGKTHTLEGPNDLCLDNGADPCSDIHAGVIPRAVQMLWKTADGLKEKGWTYSFEGMMLEIVSAY
jgi:kinesin family protein C1